MARKKKDQGGNSPTNVDDQMRDILIAVGYQAAQSLQGHFRGDKKLPPEELSDIFKAVVIGVRVSHMIQHGKLVARGQAIRILQWLPDDKARAEYIKLTNPVAAPLLER